MTTPGDHPDDGSEPVDAEVLDGAAAESALPPDSDVVAAPADQPTPPAATEGPVSEDQSPQAQVEQALAERTLDLQRLQAEYVNYKRRVDRDRDLVRETATAGVLTSMIPVLDDIERARSHGELNGGFRAVSESLERVLTGLGLVRYGEPGEPFDPRIHEALTYGFDDEVSVTTAQAILQPGYRIGDRIVRPAMVAVVEPSADNSPEATEASTEHQILPDGHVSNEEQVPTERLSE